MTPSSSLRDKVLADAAANRARTRTEGRRRAALIYAIAAAAGLPLFFMWGGIEHSADRPLALTIGIAAGALVAVAVVVPIATYVWLVSWHSRYVEPISRVGFRCLALTMVSGAPLLIA